MKCLLNYRKNTNKLPEDDLLWKGNMECPCVSQKLLFGINMETLADKKELSNRILHKGLLLYNELPKGLETVQDPVRYNQILEFLLKLNTLVRLYITKYLEVKVTKCLDINTRPTDKASFLESSNDVIKHTQNMLQLIRGSVWKEMLNHPSKQDYIYKIMRKVNNNIESFLYQNVYRFNR